MIFIRVMVFCVYCSVRVCTVRSMVAGCCVCKCVRVIGVVDFCCTTCQYSSLFYFRCACLIELSSYSAVVVYTDCSL
jgi:hypothetical protein